MHDSVVLGLRVTLGGYLAVHGAQKLFGSFDGPGLDQAGAGFEYLGLKPGKAFAALAAGSELTGGVLTALGAAQPVGPIAVAGAMTVAALAHVDKGPMAQKGGFELPASYLAAAIGLASHGPGRYSFDRLTGFRLPKNLTRLVVAGAAALTAYSAAQVIKSKRAAMSAPATATTTDSTGAVEPEQTTAEASA
jgi:putative oxidoreductase